MIIIIMIHNISFYRINSILHCSFFRSFTSPFHKKNESIIYNNIYLVKSVFKAPVPVYNKLKTSAFLVHDSRNTISNSSENF